jgi:arginase
MFVQGLTYSMLSLVNIINMPYDNGANMKGSNQAYNVLKKDLDFMKIEKTYNIDCEEGHLRTILGRGFMGVWDSLNAEKFPLLIGGDHTCAIGSIFAANEYCLMNNEKLGILWFDAYADFNTIETSLTGNLHGVPISVLCGDCLRLLSFGKYLDSNQFCYYGLRSIEPYEKIRLEKSHINALNYKQDCSNELQQWISNYDKIHLSFDMDCFDKNDFESVNTPQENGPSYENIMNTLKIVKESNKLMSMDLVEYNPTKGENNGHIVDVLKTVFD